MGACERMLVLEHRHGRVLSQEQQHAAQRGRRLHEAFLREGEAPPGAARGRCFIATCVFGADAAETAALRRYRDRVLRASPGGRCLIAWYYRIAPACCDWLGRHPAWCRPVRGFLRLFAHWAALRCRRREAGDAR